MKLCLLPLFATALPILLLQHATPVDAAALCIPGIYCPDWPSSVPPPACSCTAGNGGHGSSSSASGTTHHHHHHSSSSSPSMPVPTFSTEPEPTSTPWPKPIPRPTSHTSSTTVTIHTSRSTPVTTSSIETTSYSSSHENPPATTTVTITSGPAPSSGSCNTGPVQCCNSVEPASSENASKQLGLLGIVLQDVNIPIGITCNPISVLGLGSSGTCNAQTVCCENNNFNGLINIGCTPINLGL